MTLSIENKTSTDLTHVENLIKEFYPYAQQRLGFNKPVSASLITDPDNASDLLGKTAYYSPQTMQIAVYVDKRHPKDILRSFSHELVHHTQNCRGEFDKDMSIGEGYAQKNEHMRLMEQEAYLEGQMILRDWEDSKKITKESKKMTEEQLRTKVRETIEKVLKEGEEAQPAALAKKMEEETTEEEVNEEEINEEETLEEDEEETLHEWKERTMYQTLMEKWCK
jgi:hypothetical protein